MDLNIVSIISYVLTAVVTTVAAYYAMRKDMALAEQRIKALEARTDSHSKKIDEILEGINDIKVSLIEIKTELKHKEDKK